MNKLVSLSEDLGIVIAAGGSGSRFGGTNKLLELLAGRPVFTYSLLHFSGLCRSDALILVVPEDDMPVFAALAQQYCPMVKFCLVVGGNTRGESVRNGLAVLPSGVAYVAIHDAARPLASAALLSDCLACARENDGAIVARPVTDTLKKGSADGVITATVDRSMLWSVETPQIFALDKLRAAYATTAGREFTDDGGVMEAAGYRVRLFRNTVPNLKITYALDLALAEALLHAQASVV